MKRRVLSFIIALVLCLNLCPIRALAAGEGTNGGLCLHHPLHTAECGYVPDSPDAPCTFACRICPVEDLIGQLPDSVSENNREQVQLQLSEISALYDGLTVDEQRQVDLSLCISLQEQLDGISLAALSDDLGGSSSDGGYDMKDDISDSKPRLISTLVRFNTNGYTLTGTSSPAIQVSGTGKLYLTGKVTSKTGVGVEVLSGGYLSITGSDTLISGNTCALNIASGAEVHLSGGTYSGRYAAIQTADNKFANLLETGCAYFDGSGKLLLPAQAADARIIVIGQCGHSGKTYTPTSGTTTHTWACPYCGGVGEPEACTFTFDQKGNGTCGICGNTIAIEVNESDLTDLVYDGTMKAEDVKITVTLTGGSNTVLAKDTDYKVVYEPRKDAGEITVTVTGLRFNGTFTKTYTVAQDKPGLSWAQSNPVTVGYDGAPVEAGDLPGVNIDIESQADDLQGYLQYSYRKQGDTGYTDGLPKDAGTYEVIVSLPVLPNFEGAVSDPITLTINPINPIVSAPGAKTLTYNRNPQELVTAGTLDPAAVADGLTIEFATEEKGTYSTEIPSGTNAGNYTVWYRVKETGNYTGQAVNATSISVTIAPKGIIPVIELSERSYLYDGTKKDPKITVKDDKTVIDGDQYTVTWAGTKSHTPAEMLTVVDTYTATIKNVTGGNYTFDATATVEIVAAEQVALHITGEPSHVYYGDTVTTLGTTGGSANGTVTWRIMGDGGSSTIDPATGKLTVKDTGSITVEAKRTVTNYGTVSDTWTFTVEPKPVTAEVTIKPKDYDGTTDIADADITAAVKSSDLVSPADSISITGLKGAYDDANAGTNKPVTLDGTGASITADTAKYTVSIPTAAQADITRRQVTVTVALSDHDLQTDANGWFYAYDGTEKKPAVTVTAKDDGATLAASDYTVSYAKNKNVGEAIVTITSSAGGNYTFDKQTVNFRITSATAQLTSSPQAKDLTYTGQPQELVNVGTATGGHIEYLQDNNSYSPSIPTKTGAGTYTVTYKVVGDGNYADSPNTWTVSVTIKPKQIVSPKVTVTGTYIYNGNPQKPADNAVTVEDSGKTIPASEYTVTFRDNVEAGTATVIITNANGGDYIVNGTGTFTIGKATAAVGTPPSGRENLPYNGAAQELVTAGSASGGTMVYSLSQDGEYSPVIPTQTDLGSYTVWYKVQGDANHNGTDPDSVPASIIVNNVANLTVQVTPESVTFNGKKQEPTVTVIDGGSGMVIDGSEYTVTYADENGKDNLTSVGTYTLTITGTGTHYAFNNTTAKFEILPAGQTPLTITGKQEHVYYGDKFQLSTEGGNGTVTWAVDGAAPASIANGLLEITGVGSVTVTATSKANGYENRTATWSFYAERKPVTAVVTAEAKNYDGKTEATVTATLQQSDLVGRDKVVITLSGSFEDPNVGKDKKVNIDSTNPQFSTDSEGQKNYAITYPVATTASILAEAATVDNPPAPNTLTYDASQAQALVMAGTAAGGIMVYSLDGTNFTAAIPTAKDAGRYTVYFKAQGDGNHTDSAAGTRPVTIGKQSVTPQIELTPPSARYDGTVKRPEVTLRDSANNVIPASEYQVTYVSDNGENWTDQGIYTVKVEDISGGNYIVGEKTEQFTISITAQNPLAIVNKPGLVYYGDTFTLSAVGGSGDAAVTWSVDNDRVVEIDDNGFVKIIGTGPAVIKAKKPGGTNYDTVEATYPLNALKKPVTAIVTADDKVYDGDTNATIHIAWKDGDLLSADIGTINLDTCLTGTFDNANVGNNKTVTITGTVPDNDKYAVTYNPTTTASITPKAATVSGVAAKTLTYTGQPQELVTVGTVDGGGNVMYSLDGGASYSLNVPKATNAGTYTVWYKVADSMNYTGIDAAVVEVKIAKATPRIDIAPTASGTAGQQLSEITLTGGTANGISNARIEGTFTWADDDVAAESGILYDVIFTPGDSANYETVTCQVIAVPPVTSDSSNSSNSIPISRPDTLSTPTQTTIQNGTASTVVSAADGGRLVREAVANQSRNVVIKPKVTSDVTKAEVSIPSSTVSQLSSATDAALTVSSPIADVTISNAALDTLSQAGGNVSVAAEKVEQSVVVTLAAGGETVEQVPGGLTLTVPAEDAGPGTVAVLVHDDGTRETVRKSVVEDGVMSIPLSGSATVEIVDNSKEFNDVPSESWAADAVAFASARELFSGTSETTFSPDQTMSRGMLATVLYRLDGSPELDLTEAFQDVSSEAWYAEGVAWAVENGIAGGYGGSQFGPDDSITREQFVVMLWRYAGSPESSSQVLDFADADQVNGYAQKALCWAVENGIVHGVGNGMLDPGGTATRAQAAQLLKNFVENT